MTGPQAAVDPTGSPHNSSPHRPVHVTPAAHAESQLTAVLADLLRLTYDVQLDSGTRAAREESERVADVFRARIVDHCRERDRRRRTAALEAGDGVISSDRRRGV